jgi:CubicO group peptidase (beta-lactamase class C family)
VNLRTSLAAAALALALVNGSYGADAASLYFPPDGAEWKTISPSEAGWDEAELDAALDYAREQKSSAFLILCRGRIVAERYWPLSIDSRFPDGKLNRYAFMRPGEDAAGHPIEDVASMQKSVVALLTGVAIQQGLVRLDDPVDRHLGSGWSKAPAGEEAKITIRHLLTMTTGLTDSLQFKKPVGAEWRYNTPAYAKTMSVIEAATKMSRNELTKTWLTDPIGMADSKWVRRPRVLGADRINASGFASTARDMARFGLLVLAGGEWDGKQVIEDRAYLRQAISPTQELNPAYGFLWWLNGHPVRRSPDRTQPSLIPSAPPDLVAAQGALGRKVYVIPSLGLVVTRLGDAPEAAFNNELWKRLMAAAPSR